MGIGEGPWKAQVETSEYSIFFSDVGSRQVRPSTGITEYE